MGSGLTGAVLDSNIIIDALIGHRLAVAEIRHLSAPFISRVTWVEVLAGCRTSADDRVARDLLSSMTLVEVGAQVAEQAVAFRRGGRLKLPDAVILATARVLALPLVTRNTKDFDEADPMIRVPYRL